MYRHGAHPDVLLLSAIKRKEVGGLRDKLQNGVDKLEQSAEAVAKLQVELVNKQPILIKTQEEVHAAALRVVGPGR